MSDMRRMRKIATHNKEGVKIVRTPAAEKLLELRYSLGYSQRQMATLLGISRAMYGVAELQGHARTLDALTMKRIFKAARIEYPGQNEEHESNRKERVILTEKDVPKEIAEHIGEKAVYRFLQKLSGTIEMAKNLTNEELDYLWRTLNAFAKKPS